jgi:N-acetylneuraminic acid mutarotase
MKTHLFLGLAALLSACGGTAAAPADDAGPPDGAVVDSAPDGVATDASLDAAAVAPIASMNRARALFGAVTGKDQKVRAFGGLTNLGLSASVETYDPQADAWTVGPNAKLGRYAHAVALGADDRAYVIGGTKDGATALASVDVYDPKTDGWISAPDLPTARLGAGAAASVDGRIWVIGGGVPGKPEGAVEVFDPAKQTWAKGPDMPTPRLSLQAVRASDGRIVAIGGRDASATPLDVVEILDPSNGTWTKGPSLAVARYWFGATALGDGRVVVLGGIGAKGFVADVEVLENGAWTALPPMPQRRAWLAVAPSAGRLLAIGGSIASIEPQPPPETSVLVFDVAKNAWGSAD